MENDEYAVVPEHDENSNDRTYECPNCGAETFGLVVIDGTLDYARCRVCDEVVLDG